MLINVDTGSIRESYDVSQEQIDSFIDIVTKEITASYAGYLEQQAKENLHKTRNTYIRNIKVLDEGRMKGAVLLDYSQNPLVKMIEEGASAFDMKCIVNSNCLIFTSKGWNKIKDINIGDLVLTHRGKFQRVVNLFKEKNNDKYIYRISIKSLRKRDLRYLHVTANHPVLTNKGWVRADQLTDRHKINVKCQKCANSNCNKLIPVILLKDQKIYCSKSCAANINNDFRHKFGRIDLSENGKEKIGNKAVQTNKKMYAERKHVAQTGKLKNWIIKNVKGNSKWGYGLLNSDQQRQYQHKAALIYGKNNRNSTPELLLFDKIKHIDGLERQYVFVRNAKRKDSVNKKYFFDFAIPQHKICIEVNGEHWHTKEQDEAKKKEIEAKGWRYLSFWSKEIYSNINNCVNEINRVLANHNNEYLFDFVDFKIEKIKRKKYESVYNIKYNLTVENDSSYIANGIVTHNSGFAHSDKKHTKTNGGWYLTIPFREASPEALAESDVFSGSILPKEVYNVIQKKEDDIPTSTGFKTKGLIPTEIPEQYRAPKTRAAITSIVTSQKFEEYKHKTSIYTGVSKMTDKVTGQSSYQSFRRVSDKSDAASWIFPGLEAKNLTQKAMSDLEAHFAQELHVATELAIKRMGL